MASAIVMLISEIMIWRWYSEGLKSGRKIEREDGGEYASEAGNRVEMWTAPRAKSRESTVLKKVLIVIPI